MVQLEKSLVGMNLPDLEMVIGEGEPKFRARQIYDALYRQRVTDLGSITSLSKTLRTRLAQEISFGLPAVEKYYDSTDGTRRYLLRLTDAKTVEAVWMPEEERSTV